MNLSTAQSARRSKEVGLRKVIGANRALLVFQFIGEACLLALISTIIALVTTSMLMPAFNYLTGKSIALPFDSALFWVKIVALSLLTGFIAGSYPALFLSSLQPARIFRGNSKLSWEGRFVRQGLVIFQFVLSMMLMIGMIVVYRQMNYIQSKNLGYDRENLVYIPVEGELINKYGVFKEEAMKLPGIMSISKMRNSPTLIYHHNGSISWPGMDPNLVVPFADEVVGYDFVKTMRLSIDQGRDFSQEFATDSNAFIINQMAATKMGMVDPVGKLITWGRETGKIIGVIKDFHFNSMHTAIEPLILRLKEDWPWGTILVRIESGKTKEAMTGLEKISKTLNPQFPFTYQFSDQEFAKLYSTEQVISRLANYFAILAIFISSLGLFGLAAHTASQKNKEIGIRKVLGASLPLIALMLSRQFLKLVIIAVVVAIPMAWWISNQWLQNFAYRINLDWWVFVLAAILTLTIAVLTVAYQCLKAGMINPVKTLRSE
jgi:ABC-type antimicrobial peptide transport system permease subunit